MGIKSPGTVLRRKVDGLEIYFSWTAESVYIKSPAGWMLYHRWWAGRGSFSRIYYPFAKALKNNKNLDLAKIRRLAERYGMTPGAVYHIPPTFGGAEIVDIPAEGRRRELKQEGGKAWQNRKPFEPRRPNQSRSQS